MIDMIDIENMEEDALLQAMVDRLNERKKLKEIAKEEQKKRDRANAKKIRDAEKAMKKKLARMRATPPTEDTDESRWTVRHVDPEVRALLKAEAERTGKSYGELVSDAIRAFHQHTKPGRQKSTPTTGPRTNDSSATLTAASVKLPDGFQPKAIQAGEKAIAIVLTKRQAQLLATQLLTASQAPGGDLRINGQLRNKRITVTRKRT